MAKRNTGNNKLEDIKKVLDDFDKNNYENQIEIKGSGTYREILTKLEDLRQDFLLLQQQEVLSHQKTNANIANVAHDLKTPLALISGYAESLQCGMDDKDYLSLILEKTNYLNNLVLKIIDTSKKEAPALKEKEKVNAQTFFKSTLLSYRNLSQTRNIKLVIRNIPNVNLFIVKNDYERVMQNLISNAVKYGRDNGKITISFYVKHDFLHVVVKDNGIGIRKENIPNIFDRFYMVDEARSSEDSGLGLFITKNIVEKNNGEIFCESKLGHYTKFDFSIPIYKDEKEEELKENRPYNTILNIFLFPVEIAYMLIILFGFFILIDLLVLAWALEIGFILGSIVGVVFSICVATSGAIQSIIISYAASSIFFAGFAILWGLNLKTMTNGLLSAMRTIAQYMGKVGKTMIGVKI